MICLQVTEHTHTPHITLSHSTLHRTTEHHSSALLLYCEWSLLCSLFICVVLCSMLWDSMMWGVRVLCVVYSGALAKERCPPLCQVSWYRERDCNLKYGLFDHSGLVFAGLPENTTEPLQAPCSDPDDNVEAPSSQTLASETAVSVILEVFSWKCPVRVRVPCALGSCCRLKVREQTSHLCVSPLLA